MRCTNFTIHASAGALNDSYCFIADNVIIKNSKIGPYVSIGPGSEVLDSRISNSIIQMNSKIKNANIENSMIGNNCKYNGKGKQINIGDFSELI